MELEDQVYLSDAAMDKGSTEFHKTRRTSIYTKSLSDPH